MNTQTSRQLAGFEATLFNELNRLGVFVKPQFRVPGTDTRLDLYIASPVRAFVELKFSDSPSTLNIRRLLEQVVEVRQKFGGEIVAILVAGTDEWHSSPKVQKLTDAGIIIVSVASSGSVVSSARRCAKQIRNSLVQLPYQFKGIDGRLDPLAAMSDEFPAPTPPPSAPESSMEEVLASMKAVLAEEDAVHTQPHSTKRIIAMKTRAAPGPSLDVVEMASAPRPRDLRPASDIFVDVLVSLKSVLTPEQFQVLEHELSAFFEEYRHEHYTACALRIGRTIEHVVYALARSWGVDVNRTTLKVLSGLHNSFEQLSKTVIAYAASDESAKGKRRKAVQDQFEQVSQSLARLVFDLDLQMPPESTDVPINVELILRDIKKQFVRRKKVLETVDAIIKTDLLRKILDIRNDAAHASTSGVRRELNRSEIDAAVELLRTALFLFGNVAFAVAEKDG